MLLFYPFWLSSLVVLLLPPRPVPARLGQGGKVLMLPLMLRRESWYVMMVASGCLEPPSALYSAVKLYVRDGFFAVVPTSSLVILAFGKWAPRNRTRRSSASNTGADACRGLAIGFGARAWYCQIEPWACR